MLLARSTRYSMCTNLRCFMNYLLKQTKKNYKPVRSHILYGYGIFSFLLSSYNFHLMEYTHLFPSAFVHDLSEKILLFFQYLEYIRHLNNHSDYFFLIFFQIYRVFPYPNQNIVRET